MQVKLSLSDIQVTQVPQHPNKMLWTGIVTRVGLPSNAAPCGTGGKLLIISEEAAKNAAPSMVNMPLNCEWPDDIWFGSSPEMAMTGHDTDNIIGTVISAEVIGDSFVCSGIVWKQNFPDVAFMINNAVESLGFSIEANINSSTEDDSAVTVTDITFTGLATLWKKCAAWENTEFQQLVASRIKTKDDVDMNEDQMKALLEAMFSNVKAELALVQEKVETAVSEVKAEVDKANSKVEQLAVGLNETNEAIKASAVKPVEVIEDPVPPVVTASAAKVPVPTVLAAGQTVVPNGDFAGNKKTKKERIAEVYAGAGTIQEKMRKVVQINSEIEEVAK